MANVNGGGTSRVKEISPSDCVDHSAAPKPRWNYQQRPDGRDLRLDFLRGLAMITVIVNHIAWYRNPSLSLYHLLSLDRIGTVAAAEAFVLLSGIVLGMVSRRRVMARGWGSAASRLGDRAVQLYVVSVGVNATFYFIHRLPFLETDIFTNPLTSDVDSLRRTAADVLLLRYGPWHVNILGLYSVLLLLALPALWLLMQRRTGLLLAISWAIYVIHSGYPTHLTPALFEETFPFLAWQVLFINGLALGFHRERVASTLRSRRWIRRLVLAGVLLAFVAFIFYAHNNAQQWAGGIAGRGRLTLIPQERFWEIYGQFFDRWTLGLGRIANVSVALIMGYALLSYFWQPVSRVLGWFLIPFGQASLYVFVVHVYFALLIENIPILHQHRGLVNTVAHTLVLASIWLMIRYRILFRWIPR